MTRNTFSDLSASKGDKNKLYVVKREKYSIYQKSFMAANQIPQESLELFADVQAQEGLQGHEHAKLEICWSTN